MLPTFCNTVQTLFLTMHITFNGYVRKSMLDYNMMEVIKFENIQVVLYNVMRHYEDKRAQIKSH